MYKYFHGAGKDVERIRQEMQRENEREWRGNLKMEMGKKRMEREEGWYDEGKSSLKGEENRDP